MRQQILTKFITASCILKHFVIDDVSRVILKSYIDLLLENDNWYELYTWFAEIRFLGLNSLFTFSCNIHNYIKGAPTQKLVSINISSIIKPGEIYDILELKSHIHQILMYLIVSTMKGWHFKLQFYIFDSIWYEEVLANPKYIHDIKKIEEIFNCLKIKN